MKIKKTINKYLRKLGFEIIRFTAGESHLARRKRILDTYKINLVLDVGANYGSFVQDIRQLGYRGRVVSFEPLRGVYNQLKRNARKDNDWYTENYALGAEETTCEINIAGNSYSSSILDILENHVQTAPQSKYIGKEKILVRPLDLVLKNYLAGDDNIYLKIDTQGFEKQVLDGAGRVLSKIDTIQLEMSLKALYNKEIPFKEMYPYIQKLGYTLISIEPGFTDNKTGELLQVDGIFHRF